LGCPKNGRPFFLFGAIVKSVYGFVLFVLLTASAGAQDTENAIIKFHTDSPVFVTAAKMLEYCSADAQTTNGPEICDDYLAGVIDTIVSNRDVIQGYRLCWPTPAPTLDVLRNMTIRYMRGHPAMSDGAAASVIDTMLFDAYPCPGAPPPPG
jgi:hypothetical protein